MVVVVVAVAVSCLSIELRFAAAAAVVVVVAAGCVLFLLDLDRWWLLFGASGAAGCLPIGFRFLAVAVTAGFV